MVIQRFNHVGNDDDDMECNENGDYVKYSEHLAREDLLTEAFAHQVNRLTDLSLKRIKELEAQLLMGN